MAAGVPVCSRTTTVDAKTQKTNETDFISSWRIGEAESAGILCGRGRQEDWSPLRQQTDGLVMKGASTFARAEI